MANNKSAKKRIITTERNRLINRYYKSSVRTLTKSFLQDLNAYEASKTSEKMNRLKKILGSIYSLIDKGTKTKVFHKNTAARKKSQLASKLKAV